MLLSKICDRYLKHHGANCVSLVDQNDEGSFNPYGCDCCNSLATNTYLVNGYAPKTKEVIGLGDICQDCLCYFYNGDDREVE